MRVSGIHLGTGDNIVYDNWLVTTADPFTETEGGNYAILLTSTIASSGSPQLRTTAVNSHKFTSTATAKFKVQTSIISSNPILSGFNNNVVVKCYDSGDVELGLVYFVLGLYHTSTIYLVEIGRVVGSSSNANVESTLNLTSLYDNNDYFELTIDPISRSWGITRNGTYSADGGTLLGLLPVGTTYIKFELSNYVGNNLEGIYNMSVESIL